MLGLIFCVSLLNSCFWLVPTTASWWIQILDNCFLQYLVSMYDVALTHVLPGFSPLMTFLSGNFVSLSLIPSVPITYKVTLCLAFLIAIRGCLPRYRYDYLTKLGWVKFLGHVLAYFIFSLILTIFW